MSQTLCSIPGALFANRKKPIIGNPVERAARRSVENGEQRVRSHPYDHNAAAMVEAVRGLLCGEPIDFQTLSRELGTLRPPVAGRAAGGDAGGNHAR